MPLKVDIWSDVVCPWCYIGKRRFEAALSRFPHREEVAVQWHSFELDPTAPPIRSEDYAARLAEKYRVDLPQARSMIDNVTNAARKEGLHFQLDVARSGNTFNAHRLLHLATRYGVQGALKERLFKAYFTEGEPIGSPEVLARLAGEVGLEVEEARLVLEGDAYAEAVREDEQHARQLGITGVPCFVIGQKYGVSGAQPPEVLLEVLTRAWSEAQSRE